MTNEIEVIEITNQLNELLESKNYREMKTILNEMSEADIAEFLDSLPFENAMRLFRLLSKEKASETFSYFQIETQEKIITSASDEEVRLIIEEISVDDAVDMLEELPASIVKRVLKNASAETRSTINRFLNYPEDSVGSIMTSEFTDIKGDMTVGEAIRYLRQVAENKETVYTCYIVGRARLLEGVIELADFLACRDDEVLISEIMEINVIKAVTTEHREAAAELFSKYDLHTLPVVDKENRLVGIVTADDILDVIEEEATKDIEQMAAIVPMEDEYLKTGVFTIVKKRIVWLFVLMITGILTGSILGSFEATIATVPVLVTFMPMILNTGGNSGSQSSITVIRGLTTGELEPKDIWRILFKELRVAIIVGVLFGIVNFGMVYVLAGNVPGRASIALVVSLAMLFVIILAKCIGAVLPIIASKLRLDPTVMATPLITTCVDVCAMLVYFSLAVNLLSSML